MLFQIFSDPTDLIGPPVLNLRSRSVYRNVVCGTQKQRRQDAHRSAFHPSSTNGTIHHHPTLPVSTPLRAPFNSQQSSNATTTQIGHPSLITSLKQSVSEYKEVHKQSSQSCLFLCSFPTTEPCWSFWSVHPLSSPPYNNTLFTLYFSSQARQPGLSASKPRFVSPITWFRS